MCIFRNFWRDLVYQANSGICYNNFAILKNSGSGFLNLSLGLKICKNPLAADWFLSNAGFFVIKVHKVHK